jgi:hypothetical protein
LKSQRHIFIEQGRGRRRFIQRGLIGTALLTAGGLALSLRGTRRIAGLGGMQVLDADQASVLLAVAGRLIPNREGFPRPSELKIAAKVDAILARADEPTQREVRQLLGLFESALTGFLLDGQPQTFTASSPDDQDARLEAWRDSRLTVRRSGYKAIRGLCLAAYYSDPQIYAAIGYGGPPEIAG